MQQSHSLKWAQIDWPTTSFLILTPLAGVIGTGVAIYLEGFSWGMFLFGFIFAILTNLSITTGYHRLYSHRSYEANSVVKWFLVLIGTSAWQSSVLKWCTDHRVHHSEIDSDQDPYSINKGFWFAHMGWMFQKEAPGFKIHCPDLEKEALLKFQHEHYIKLAVGIGFLMPWLVGWFFGYPWQGLFMVGALRIGMTQQSTFFVNSLSHTMGRQTYSDLTSARDSLFVAVLTHGEGYHNFHHKFQFDYRNGIRWWQWDPTKWTIEFMAWAGLARKLRTVSQSEILKARLQVEATKLKARGYSAETLEAMREQMVRTQIRLRQLKDEYQKTKTQYLEHSRERVEQMKVEIRLAKLDLKYSLRTWKTLLKTRVRVHVNSKLGLPS